MDGAADCNIEACTIHRSPHAFINKRDEAILVKPLSERRHEKLIEMYLAYEPKNSFGGLPPVKDDVCVEWVRGMIGTGVNLVALSFKDGIVGHAALFPINERACEMLVVVSPAYQNTGIGTELARCLVRMSHEMGFEKIWLSVESTNLRARHVYKKCGFEYVTYEQDGHVEMDLDLKQFRDVVSVSVSDVMGRDVITIHPEASCRTAVELFLKNEISSLPVVNKKHQVVGIISETDLMQPANIRKKVGDILTRGVITVQKDCSIEKVIPLFHSKKPRCIPVVGRNMKLLGVISRKDVLVYYARRFDGMP